MTTALGAIEVAVDLARAPISAGDFLKYVIAGSSMAALLRTVRPDNGINPVKMTSSGRCDDDKKLLPPIPHEPTSKTGLRHRNGTYFDRTRQASYGLSRRLFHLHR